MSVISSIATSVRITHTRRIASGRACARACNREQKLHHIWATAKYLKDNVPWGNGQIPKVYNMSLHKTKSQVTVTCDSFEAMLEQRPMTPVFTRIKGELQYFL